MKAFPRIAGDPDTIGYRRVSKGEQAVDWKSSLRDQTVAIQALATRRGRVLEDHHIVEDRFSGEDAESRPGFMALVQHCFEHPRPRSHLGLLVFLNDSRFGRFREPDEAAYWRYQLLMAGWEVRFAENDDTDDVTARHVLRAVGGATASEYLSNLRKNVRRGTAGAAAKGLWQNEAPVGYRRLATGDGRGPVVLDIGERKADNQQVRLTPGPESEVKAVRWAYESYADGSASLRQIAAEMRRRVPRLKWSPAQVHRMLVNWTYHGHVIWGRRPHDKRERRERPVRPQEEWTCKLNAHPALIDQDLWDRVQARRVANRKERRSAEGGYPLSGLIRCAVCGEPYVGGGGPKNKKNPSDPDRYRFYRDRGGDTDRHASDVLCPGRLGTLQKRIVEPLVIAEVAAIVSDPLVQRLIREEIDRRISAARADHGGTEASLRDERKELEERRSRLVGAIARGTITAPEADHDVAQIRAGLARVQGDLARLATLKAAASEVSRERDRLVALAADFAARARELKGYALRELLRPWLQDARFHKETRELTLTIRRVPAAAGPLEPSASAPTDAEVRRDPLLIARVVLLPPAGAARGPRNYAVGRPLAA